MESLKWGERSRRVSRAPTTCAIVSQSAAVSGVSHLGRLGLLGGSSVPPPARIPRTSPLPLASRARARARARASLLYVLAPPADGITDLVTHAIMFPLMFRGTCERGIKNTSNKSVHQNQ